MPGYVRADMTAVSRLYDWHFTAETPQEAIRQGLTAGVDMELYDFPHEVWQGGIAELLADGRLDPAVLDEACRRILRIKFRLGLFEHPYTDESREEKALRCPDHLALARKIAERSAVLLKNQAAFCRFHPPSEALRCWAPARRRPCSAIIPKPAAAPAPSACWMASAPPSAPKPGCCMPAAAISGRIPPPV